MQLYFDSYKSSTDIEDLIESKYNCILNISLLSFIYVCIKINKSHIQMIIQELLLICRGSINENQRRKAMFRKQKKKKKALLCNQYLWFLMINNYSIKGRYFRIWY